MIGSLNDLWQYNVISNRWTWMGSSDTVGSVGTYGSRGVTASSNWPGARYFPQSFVNPSTGMFYLFGGHGYAKTTTLGTLNIQCYCTWLMKFMLLSILNNRFS